MQDFWSRVKKTPSCWLWLGSTTEWGYGQMGIDSTNRLAHRISYEDKFGPVQKGLYLDHLCRVRHCVNPDHLEVVTSRENMVRSYAARGIGKMPHGVYRRSKNCYVAKKWWQNKGYYLGSYKTPEEASVAYQTAIIVG